MAGTLIKPPSNIKRFSKIINITGMSPAATKTALDEFLNKGWQLGTIYDAGAQIRAVMIRTKDG